MESRNSHFLPHARQEALIVQELPDEVLVYDTDRHKAHCLNPTAALIWKHCDGQTSVAAMTRILQEKLAAGSDESMVWHALAQLSKFHLLQERMPSAPEVGSLTRRELIAKAGMAAASLALITTVASPAAAQSASCSPIGGPCSTVADCCVTPGVICFNGNCQLG